MRGSSQFSHNLSLYVNCLSEDDALVRVSLSSVQLYPSPGAESDTIIDFIDRGRDRLSTLRFQLEGTSFQKKVWEEARKIRPGSVTSYSCIAKALGKPHGSRAVGQALRRNKLLILVPCHRVIASDGRLGGFSAAGGLDVKERLLSIEKRFYS